MTPPVPPQVRTLFLKKRKGDFGCTLGTTVSHGCMKSRTRPWCSCVSSRLDFQTRKCCQLPHCQEEEMNRHRTVSEKIKFPASADKKMLRFCNGSWICGTEKGQGHGHQNSCWRPGMTIGQSTQTQENSGCVSQERVAFSVYRRHLKLEHHFLFRSHPVEDTSSA